MALRSGFTVQNVNINAEPARQALASLVPNNGGLVQAGDYAVSQTTTPSMAVSVGVGRIWVPGTAVSNISGQKWGTQAQYHIVNDAPVTLTIQPADATNPRIDVVYVGMQDSQYSGTNNGEVLAVATGTAIAGAAYPTNAPSIPANCIALAWVYVGNGVSSIINSNITMLATGCTPPFGHMGRTAGFQGLTGGLTTVGMSSAQILRGGMTFANNALTVPIGGLYEVRTKFYTSGSSAGQYILEVYKNGSFLTGPEVWFNKSDTSHDYTAAGAPTTVLLNAGDSLNLQASTVGSLPSANTWGTDGYNGTFLEVEYRGA